jgi:hypothetical protein
VITVIHLILLGAIMLYIGNTKGEDKKANLQAASYQLTNLLVNLTLSVLGGSTLNFPALALIIW